MSAGQDPGDWFALSRALLVEAASEPDEAEVPAEAAPAPRRGWLAFMRPAPRRARPPAPRETPSSRANRVALAATARDWDALDAADRDLLSRALATDPAFAPLAAALGAAPPQAERPFPTPDDPDAGFVFEPLPRVATGFPACPPARTAPEAAQGAAWLPAGTPAWAPAPASTAPGTPTPGPAAPPAALASVVPAPRYPTLVAPGADRGHVRESTTATPLPGSPGTEEPATTLAKAPGHAPPGRATVRAAGIDMPVADALEAPVLAMLRGECGGTLALRSYGGVLVRPATLPGGLDPVTPGTLDAALRDDPALSRVADTEGFVIVDGAVHLRTRPPTLHVACVRSVRPLGRTGGWLQPGPSDGYRLAWRFSDGPDSLGSDGGGRRDRTVTWDLADDPGPDLGMVPPPHEPREPVVALGLAHASVALGTFMAAMDALGPLRPGIVWRDPDVPDVLRGHEALMSPDPDGVAERLGDGPRATAVAEALWSATHGQAKGFGP